MKEALLALAAIGWGTFSANATGGSLGVVGTCMETDGIGKAYGGGLKFKFGIADYLAAELRASSVTRFEEDDIECDNLFGVPVKADPRFNFPLRDTPITGYVGSGEGYYVMQDFQRDSPSGTVDVDFADILGFFGVGGVMLALDDEVDEVEIDDVAVDPDGENAEFTGSNANAGVLFRF